MEEWAHPTKKLLMIRARGEVAEPAEEEAGGVGGEEEGAVGTRQGPRLTFKSKWVGEPD